MLPWRYPNSFKSRITPIAMSVSGNAMLFPLPNKSRLLAGFPRHAQAIQMTVHDDPDHRTLPLRRPERGLPLHTPAHVLEEVLRQRVPREPRRVLDSGGTSRRQLDLHVGEESLHEDLTRARVSHAELHRGADDAGRARAEGPAGKVDGSEREVVRRVPA